MCRLVIAARQSMTNHTSLTSQRALMRSPHRVAGGALLAGVSIAVGQGASPGRALPRQLCQAFAGVVPAARPAAPACFDDASCACVACARACAACGLLQGSLPRLAAPEQV